MLLAMLLLPVSGAAGADASAEQSLGHADFVPSGRAPVGWRGDGSGRFAAASPPMHFDIAAGINVLWSVPTPAFSNCQPIVVRDRVFITAEPDLLLCYDLATGAERWRREHRDLVAKPGRPQFPEWRQGYACSTPVSDGQHVVVHSGTGVVACYDLDGRRRWAVAVREDVTGGSASSPIIIGRLVVQQTCLTRPGEWVDSTEACQLLAWDIRTGKEIWRIEARGGAEIGCGSPTVLRDGRAVWLLTAGTDLVDPRSGTVLARLPFDGGGASPAWLDDRRSLMHIGHSEGGDKPEHRHQLIRVDFGTGKGGRPPVAAVQWRAKLETHYPKVYKAYASPLVVGDVAYAMRVGGELLSFDFSTGALHGELVLAEGNSDAYASPTLAGAVIWTIVARKDGSSGVAILRPGPQPERLFSGVIPEPVRGNPFFHGSRVLIRSLDKLYCLGEPETAR